MLERQAGFSVFSVQRLQGRFLRRLRPQWKQNRSTQVKQPREPRSRHNLETCGTLWKYKRGGFGSAHVRMEEAP